MISQAFTVGTTPTLIVDAEPMTRHIYLHVVGNTAIYLGDANVTTSTGLLTEKHTSPIEIVVPPGEQIYAVVVAATESVRVLTPNL